LNWIKLVANANQFENKAFSGVLFKTAFVVTLNSLRSAGSTLHDARRAAAAAPQPQWHATRAFAAHIR
jgi:hypothetical protein